MYSSTSVRWIVYTLLPNRTYESSLGVAPLITLRIVVINPTAVVAATNFNLDVSR